MSASEARPDPVATLDADYFDGRSSRAHRVRLQLSATTLQINGDGFVKALPLRSVRWPERTRHGPRIAHLADGGSLHCADSAAWDAWRSAAGFGDGAVVRWQQSWRATVFALIGVLLLCAAGYRWGLPLAAHAVLALVPQTVDRELGQAALTSLIDQRWLEPSERPPAEQQRLRAAFQRAIARADGSPGAPSFELHFHKSPRLGANALALPGGAIVLTDEMVTLVDAREDILVGVLAHEFGHVRHRHGMRLVAQAALLGVATSALYGDFSTLLAGVPTLLGHLGYSRDFEREADTEAIRVLRANGIAPRVMATMFERLAQQRGGGSVLPIALASHPSDDERLRRFDAGR